MDYGHKTIKTALGLHMAAGQSPWIQACFEAEAECQPCLCHTATIRWHILLAALYKCRTFFNTRCSTWTGCVVLTVLTCVLVTVVCSVRAANSSASCPTSRCSNHWALPRRRWLWDRCCLATSQLLQPFHILVWMMLRPQSPSADRTSRWSSKASVSPLSFSSRFRRLLSVFCWWAACGLSTSKQVSCFVYCCHKMQGSCTSLEFKTGPKMALNFKMLKKSDLFLIISRRPWKVCSLL